jgi:protein dispatched 1
VLQTFDYKGMFVAAKDWVTAVTYTQIAESVYSTVFLSIVLSGIVVFVFCGRPVVTLLAVVTLLMINLTVMGVLYTWGWYLGAIEGMSITSLVGLAVDFTIHISEAHLHAQAESRRWKARYAQGYYKCRLVL